VIYNNTIYGNGIGHGGSCCYPAIVISPGTGNVIKNNIVFNNAVNGIANSATSTVISNNLTVDPKFLDSATSNFRLQSTSPAIDNGTSSIAQGITILFNGSAPDIGAYEY